MDASVACARARSCSRVAARAHALALEAVLSPHRTASARSAGRHLFKTMMIRMPLHICPRPWRGTGAEHFLLVTHPGDDRILRPHLRCARAAPRTIPPHGIPLRTSILCPTLTAHACSVCAWQAVDNAFIDATNSEPARPTSMVAAVGAGVRWCYGAVAV